MSQGTMAPRFSIVRKPCQYCLRAAKWLPVLFIVTVVVWSYYAYVIQLNLFTIDSIIEKCFYLFVYHIILVFFLWAYWQTIFAEVGVVPKQFRLAPADLDRYESAETDEIRRDTLERFTQKNNLPVYNRTMTGDIRYCEKCCHVKPDRCHHCSVCGYCVLKMDHHCPWVNNCVSFSNYKFFVLFLGYALIYCLFIAATTLQYFILFWKNQLEGLGKFHILFVFFVAIMFAISLVSLFGYHLFLVFRNRSTLESFRAPIFRFNHTWVQDKEGFSLGAYNNFVEIFGDNPKTWFLPMFTSLGDGVTYPVQGQTQPTSGIPPVQSYGSTQTSIEDGVANPVQNSNIHEGSKLSPASTDPVVSPEATKISLGDGVTYPQRCIEEDMDGLLSQQQHWAEENDSDMSMTLSSARDHNLVEVIVQPNNVNSV